MKHCSWLNFLMLLRVCLVNYILMHTDCCTMKYIHGIICGDDGGAYV